MEPPLNRISTFTPSTKEKITVRTMTEAEMSANTLVLDTKSMPFFSGSAGVLLPSMTLSAVESFAPPYSQGFLKALNCDSDVTMSLVAQHAMMKFMITPTSSVKPKE